MAEYDPSTSGLPQAVTTRVWVRRTMRVSMGVYVGIRAGPSCNSGSGGRKAANWTALTVADRGEGRDRPVQGENVGVELSGPLLQKRWVCTQPAALCEALLPRREVEDACEPVHHVHGILRHDTVWGLEAWPVLMNCCIQGPKARPLAMKSRKLQGPDMEMCLNPHCIGSSTTPHSPWRCGRAC